jgi:hypothetical protein
MGFRLVWVGQDAARARDELAEPGRCCSVQVAEHALEDGLPFRPPAGEDRRGRDVGYAEVGEDVVHGRAVVAEQLAQPHEGGEVTAVGQLGDAEGAPGPRCCLSAFRRVDGGERP